MAHLSSPKRQCWPTPRSMMREKEPEGTRSEEEFRMWQRLSITDSWDSSESIDHEEEQVTASEQMVPNAEPGKLWSMGNRIPEDRAAEDAMTLLFRQNIDRLALGIKALFDRILPPEEIVWASKILVREGDGILISYLRKNDDIQ